MSKKILTSPRMEGIEEQFERAKFFLDESQTSQDRLGRFRRLVASIYFARAIVELMLEAAYKQEVPKSRDDLGQILVKILPHYMLIEKLRIHDFHRFGLLERQGVFIGGPIKLIASQGYASLRITPEGDPESNTTGNSQVRGQRPLTMKGDHVFDEDINGYIPIDSILTEYLSAVPEAIEEFQKLFTQES